MGDNVANGCNGPGMIFFATGAAETFEDVSGAAVNRYVGFPRGAVTAGPARTRARASRP